MQEILKKKSQYFLSTFHENLYLQFEAFLVAKLFVSRAEIIKNILDENFKIGKYT